MLRAAAALVFATSAVVESAVIGIDLGGEYIKASLVKPRVPLDIVLNPEGRRRSEAVVGFFDGEQAYGGAALNQVRLCSPLRCQRAAMFTEAPTFAAHPCACSQQSRRPANFVAYLKMLVGKGPESGNLQWLKDAHYPHEWTGTEEGTLQVSLGTTGLGDDMNEYTVVELLSMLLTKQREDAEAIAEEAIKDVVITVPPFWAQDERQALLDAAELSKMNVLGLLVRTYLTPNRPLIDP